MTHATPPLHQAVTIEHGMNGALGGNRNPGEPADHALADLPRMVCGFIAKGSKRRKLDRQLHKFMANQRHQIDGAVVQFLA